MKGGMERGRGEGGIEEGREAGMEEELHKTNPILSSNSGASHECLCLFLLSNVSKHHSPQTMHGAAGYV